jgi:hypothetical protein
MYVNAFTYSTTIILSSFIVQIFKAWKADETQQSSDGNGNDVQGMVDGMRKLKGIPAKII